MMTITVNGEIKTVEEGISLRQILALYSPFGEEATILIRNDEFLRSIDLCSDEQKAEDGDIFEIVPLIIGG